MGNSSIWGLGTGEGRWGEGDSGDDLLYRPQEDNKMGVGGSRVLMKDGDPGVGSAANFSEAWEISLRNERGREEHRNNLEGNG